MLNLRHSLPAAYVALRNADRARWTAPLNVNQVLDRQLGDTFAWLGTPAFRRLL